MHYLNIICALDLKAIYAIAAGIAIALVGMATAIAMAIVISKAVDGIARQPEAEGKIRAALMIGLIFIETVIIYALLIAILLIINIL